MAEFAGVHGEQNAGFAGVGQNEARVLVALFARCAKTLLPAFVPALHLRHLGFVLGDGVLTQSLNGRGDDVAKTVGVAYIALALNAEGGNAVAGELGQQHAAHALGKEGEGNVLQNAFMPHGHDLFHKGALIFFLNGGQQFIQIAAGVAQAGAEGGQGFGLHGVAHQLDPLGALGHGRSLLTSIVGSQFKKFQDPLILTGQVQVAQKGFQRGGAAVGVGILIFGRIVTCMGVLAAAEDIRLFFGQMRFNSGGALRLRTGIDPLDGLFVQSACLELCGKQLLAGKQIPDGIAHKSQRQRIFHARLLNGERLGKQ